MLNVFRKRQSLVKVVLGFVLFLVCITMVITLIPGITGDAGDLSGNPVVAEVAGDRITTFEVQQNLQQVAQRNRIPSDMMPFYGNQIVNEMVLEKASLQEAERLGLKVPESELLEQLRRNPNFFPNGNFIGEQQYEDLIAEQTGMNVRQFEERVRQELLINKLRELVSDSVTVSPEDVRKAFNDQNEKVVLDYVLLSAEDFKKSINPSESALQEFYKSKKDQFQVPEKRSAKILKIDNTKVQETVKVSDAEIEKYYRDHTDTYRTPERVSLNHILLKADSKDSASMDRARKKAEELVKKLRAGADFATVATENSDDKASSPKGGALGWIVRKQTAPEVEKVAFSIQPLTVSDPIQTVYGFEIIKVMMHEQPRVTPLAEAKPEIQKTLTQERVQRAAAEDADQAATALKRSPADIDAIAAKYHGVVLTPPPFGQMEPVANIAAPPQFTQEVFGLKKGQVGSSYPLADGYIIPVLTEIIPAHAGEFAEVKEPVQREYVQQQAREKASAKMDELAKLVDKQEKKDLKQAAKSLGVTLKTSPAVTRTGMIPSLSNMKDLDPKTFQVPVGTILGPVQMAEGKVLYQVESKESPKEEDFAKQKDQVRETLLDQKRQLVFETFQDSLKNKLAASGRLKINKEALAQVAGTGSKR